MGIVKTTDFLLYRWRYVIGYIFIAIMLLSMLYIITFIAPGGLSEAEMQSTVTSAHLPPIMELGGDPDSLIHWPYHLLQSASIALFGVSTLSVKLPSILLALGAIAALYGLLRIWFRQNIAIISTTIAVATGQFLFYAQLGTPEVSYLFWNASLLACVSMLARTSKVHWLWLIGTVVFGALSLYSPYQLYMVVALLLTSFLHPHARWIVFRKQSPWLLAVCLLLFGLLVTPLALAFVKEPSLIMTYLGIPTDWALLSWGYTKHVALQYVAFWQAGSGAHVTPIYGLGLVLLGLLGVYRLFTAKYTAKSYIITIWIVFLIPVLFLNIGAVSLTFVPLMLLVAFAIDYLVGHWYKLFPINPYARIAGLIPLTVLVLSLVLSGVERFVYGYHYDPRASQVFSKDVALLNTTLKDLDKNATIYLLVNDKNVPFYQTYADTKTRAPSLKTVSSSTAGIPIKSGAAIIITDASHKLADKYPSEIIVDSTSTDANRFYLYKN